MNQTQKIIIGLLIAMNVGIFCVIAPLLVFMLSQQPTPVVSLSAGTPTHTVVATFTTLLTPTSLPTYTPTATVQPTPLATPTLDPSIGGVTIKAIDLLANDLLFDPARQQIYASVPGRAISNGNSIVAISVPTGTIRASILVGSEPNRLALSHDSRYLYVGLDGAGAVRRVNLVSQTAELQFSLGAGFCGTHRVEDMLVLSNNPRAVVISKRNRDCSPRHEGVAVYDDGVQRPKTTAAHTGSNVLTFSASPNIIYGYNNETTEYGLRTMTITPDGVTVSATVQNLLSGFHYSIHFENGLIYSGSGQVVDTKTMTLVGTFPSRGLVAIDSKAGRAYFLTLSTPFGPFQIKAYDLQSYALQKTMDLKEIDGIPTRFIQVGTDLFAIATNESKVYLVRIFPMPVKQAQN